MSEPAGKVLDLAPMLRRKRAGACKHPTVLIDDGAASATCEDCGAEIDPWLLLRQIANERDDYDARIDAELAAKLAEANAHLDKLRRQLAYYTDEVNELIERRNRLWHEQINGKPLGTYRKTRARKQPVAAPPTAASSAAPPCIMIGTPATETAHSVWSSEAAAAASSLATGNETGTRAPISDDNPPGAKQQ